MDTVKNKKEQFMGKRHVLPINNAGLYRKVNEPIQEIKQGQAEFLPIKEINVEAQICDSISTVKITQVYVNPSNVNPQDEEVKEEEKPIEISYKFPKVADQIIAGMKVSIGDKTIEANIMEKEKAQDKYDNAVSSGNQAALMKEAKGEFLELQIGNIKPGQTATIEITIVQHLESTNGAFDFEFPLTYFPKYTIPKKDRTEEDKILFNFRTTLKSTNGGFSEISHPDNFEILEQKTDSTIIQKISSDYHEMKENLKISFRLQNMDDTRFMFQKSDKYPDQVAVMASFLPTFTSSENTNKTVVTAGSLEEQDLPKDLESKYQFIFLIDRSGSMGMNDRIQITNDAVILFLQSLPSGCKFGMLGFGSNSQWCAGEMNDYNNQTKERAINEAKYFDSNYGGTDILQPIVTAATLETGQYKKRIFLLTDGQVGNKQEIVNYCESMCANNDDTKVFTFGIGNGCDEDLVRRVAQAGRGSYSIVGDNNPKDLKEKVINSLRKASDPALQKCSFNLGQESFELGELYRNQAIRCCSIMTQSDFDKLSCNFKSEYDPKTKVSLNQTWSKDSFKEFDSTDDSLFKLCAKAEIDKTKTYLPQKIKLSTKYQVLCSETSFIGIVKNKDKVNVEMEKVEIQSINYAQQEKVQQKQMAGNFYNKMSQRPANQQRSYQSSAMSYGCAPQQMAQSSMQRSYGAAKCAGPRQSEMMMKCSAPQSAAPERSMRMRAGCAGPSKGAAPKNQMRGMMMMEEAAPQNKQAEPQKSYLGELFSMFGGNSAQKESKPKAAEQMKQNIDVDDMADLMDEMAESQENQDFFSQAKDESLEELNELEAEMACDQMQDMSFAPAMSIAAPARAPVVPKIKPTFQSLINAQDSNGFWTSSSTSMILQFLDNPSEVSNFLKENKDIEQIVLTMLAIYILELNFNENKAEWDMICSKAKKWIRQQNIDAERKKRLDNKAKNCINDDKVMIDEEDELAAMMAM